MLWLKLMDSTTTRSASDKGIAKARGSCARRVASPRPSSRPPTWTSCPRRSAPRWSPTRTPTCSSSRWTASSRPPSRACRARGSATRSKVISSSSDLAGLQRIKDGQQVSDLGTPVIYEGWKYANALMQLLAGDEVVAVEAEDMVTRDFNADNVGDLELSTEAYFTPDWFGDDAFKQVFLTAWGVDAS